MDTEFISSVIAYADQHKLSSEPTPTGVGGLSIVRAREPSALKNTLYAPLLCLVLQGQKQTRFGDETITFSTGDTLIVSIHIPTVSQVTVASSVEPYVSLAIEIDLDLVRSLKAELNLSFDSDVSDSSIASGAAQSELEGAMQRLFNLHHRPLPEQSVMAPLLIREIHFRMLFEHHGGMLRRFVTPESHESRINKAILKLQKDFAEPIAVKELAALSGMGVSSFHEHFKAVTTMTPLQFLKDIRLHIARQKLIISSKPVSAIGYEVGYESAAHFSRDYDRKFGHPPSRKRFKGS